MLPVGNITLTLGLYDASGNALKTWSVQDNGNTTFNITANHFYGLGQKVSKGDVTGGRSCRLIKRSGYRYNGRSQLEYHS